MLEFMRKFLVGLFALALIIPAAPAQAVPNESAYVAVEAESMWNQGFTGEGTTIALIDQGVNLNHPYFKYDSWHCGWKAKQSGPRGNCAGFKDLDGKHRFLPAVDCADLGLHL
jgi:hypothetical protein